MPDVLKSKSFKIVIQPLVNLLVNKFAGEILQSRNMKVRDNFHEPFCNYIQGNGPFPSCLKPLFQSEAKCEAIDMKMISYSHVKTHFHKKGLTLSLV